MMDLLNLMMKNCRKIAKTLSLTENPSIKEPSVGPITDLIKLLLRKYKDYSSIKSIRNKMFI